MNASTPGKKPGDVQGNDLLIDEDQLIDEDLLIDEDPPGTHLDHLSQKLRPGTLAFRPSSALSPTQVIGA